VKANRYRIKVCDSATDYAHGFSREVEEICVPELGLFINLEACFTMSAADAKRRIPKKFEVLEVNGDLARIIAEAKISEKKFRELHFLEGVK
jgi:hypothetical protein